MLRVKCGAPLGVVIYYEIQSLDADNLKLCASGIRRAILDAVSVSMSSSVLEKNNADKQQSIVMTMALGVHSGRVPQ